MKAKSIFISDLHLGSKGCQADTLNDFLKNIECENLFLIGDIIDIWKMQRGKWNWTQSHINVIRKILGKAKKGTNVIYVLGNHDEFFRTWASEYDLSFGNITIVNRHIYETNGKKYVILHGDIFDGITKMNRWLYFLGDAGYDLALWLNQIFNKIRKRFGFQYWSLSKWLKNHVKEAVKFISDFEINMVKYCKKHGYDGIIAGHIHTPSIKKIDGIEIMNDGDFVENCSALIEHFDGTFEIIHWRMK